MKRFTLVQRGDAASQDICTKIRDALVENNFTYDIENPELVICVGGDGTLLKAFHDWLHIIDDVAFVGIHSGTLGFSTDYTKDCVDQFIKDVIHNEPVIEEKRILEALCINDTREMHVCALNEIRVENIVKTQPLDIYIDDCFFETFRGNGVCISGQYGSTAYNRSIGGAVIFPGLDLLQLTEISGIHHRYARSLDSPLIMKPESKIILKSDSFDHALLCYDHLHKHLDGIHEIRISSYPKVMRFARFNDIPHIQRLNALF